jgi:hypothetical protein
MWLQDPLCAGGAASVEQLGGYTVPLRHCFSKAKTDTNVTIIDTEGNGAIGIMCSGLTPLQEALLLSRNTPFQTQIYFWLTVKKARTQVHASCG